MDGGNPPTKRRKAAETVRFNVGGKIFEVLREPTLTLHPNSILSQLAEDPDASQPIFVEANGDIFQYILDYHRHRKIYIPITVSVAAIIREGGILGLDIKRDEVVQEEPPLAKIRTLLEETTAQEAKKAEAMVCRSKTNLLADMIIQRVTEKNITVAKVRVKLADLDEWCWSNLTVIKQGLVHGHEFDNLQILEDRLNAWACKNGYTVEIHTSGGFLSKVDFSHAVFRPVS